MRTERGVKGEPLERRAICRKHPTREKRHNGALDFLVSLVENETSPLRLGCPASGIDCVVAGRPLSEGLLGATPRRKAPDVLAVDSQPPLPAGHDIAHPKPLDDNGSPPVPVGARPGRLAVEHEGLRLGHQAFQIVSRRVGGGFFRARAARDAGAGRPLDVDVAGVCTRASETGGVESPVEIEDEYGVGEWWGHESGYHFVEEWMVPAGN